MDSTKQQLTRQGFAPDQIQEIEEGLKSGLNVKVYAKKDFLSIQMRQIRLGLLAGLPVEKYASADYDWLQMEEIRKGLSEGINVDVYAYPEISYDKMQQIRKGLQVGIDLSPYRKLQAGILKQLRRAVMGRVNIVPYINAGYDAEQLEVIRTALEKGMDPPPFLNRAFRGISMQEIYEGIDHGIDVSAYAKPEYYWQQMREIRLGLEEGLDVSYYRSLMYTAREMNTRRMALKNHTASIIPAEKVHPQETDHSDCYSITISPDEMEAVLEIHSNVKECRREDILKVLYNHGICYGICYEQIESIVRGNLLLKSIPIAKGMPVRDGKDGWYEFFFRTEVARTPKVLEDGNVDYRRRKYFHDT